MNHRLCLIALLLVACGKEAPQPAPKVPAATSTPVSLKPIVPEKKLPLVPQGKLPQMDPEKAKFIAIPSTPKDPEVKKVEKPADKPATEIKKVEKPVPEVKKATPESTKQ